MKSGNSPLRPSGIDVPGTGIGVELAPVTAINVLATWISVELAEATAVGNILAAGVSGTAAKGAASVRRWHKEQGSHYSAKERELAKHLVFNFLSPP
jgi:hypothetical protein